MSGLYRIAGFMALLICATPSTAWTADTGSQSGTGNQSTSLGLSTLPTTAGTVECDISNSTSANSPCPGGNDAVGQSYTGTGTGNSNVVGARSITNSSAATAIDAFGICRYVDNGSIYSIFLPFKYASDWQSFINNTPPGITLVTCARPDTLTVTPDTRCNSPSPTSQSYTLPYARTGATITKVTNFTCTVDGLCGSGTPACGANQTWTETVTTTFTAATPSPAGSLTAVSNWTSSNSYAGTEPTANPAPVNGVCGVGANACTAGTASSESNSNGTALWICAGQNGGASSAQCSSCDSGYDMVSGTCVQDINGACGASAYACSAGSAIDEAYASNTSTWTCEGQGTGTNASCRACDANYGWNGSACTLIVYGACNNTVLDGCASNGGTPANESSSASTSTWVCDGSSGNGGTNSPTCSICNSGYAWNGSTCVQVIDGVCGSAAWSCNAGSPDNGSNSGSTETWTCDGSNGGTTASCRSCDSGYNWNGSSCASVVTGTCNNSTIGGCSAGTPVSETNEGSATYWVCQGSNGGSNSVECGACNSGYAWNGSACAQVINGSCSGTQWQCAAGTATDGSDSGGKSTWYCDGSNGGSDSGQCSSCDSGYTASGSSCVQVINASCSGTADQCAAGTPSGNSSSLNSDDTAITESWTCNGNGGGTSTVCATVVAECGSGAQGYFCTVGSETGESDAGGVEAWECIGGNNTAIHTLCHKNNFQPH